MYTDVNILYFRNVHIVKSLCTTPVFFPNLSNHVIKLEIIHHENTSLLLSPLAELNRRWRKARSGLSEASSQAACKSKIKA